MGEKPIAPRMGTARTGDKTAATTAPTPVATRETRAPGCNFNCHATVRTTRGHIPIIFDEFFEDIKDK